MLVVLVGTALSLGLYLMLADWERKNIEQEFHRASETRFSRLAKAANTSMMILSSIQGFYDGSEHVSRLEFQKFVKPYTQNEIGVHSLGWIPAVSSEDRARHEELAHADGLPSYLIHEPTDKGKTTAAAHRVLHFPLQYREPENEDKTALGLDLASFPYLLDLLNISADTGQAVATDKPLPLKDDSADNTYLVFAPVYKGGSLPLSIHERNNRLDGFVFMSIRLTALIENTLDDMKAEGIAVFLHDIFQNKKTILYSHLADESQFNDSINGLHDSRELMIAGHRWIVTCAALPAFHDRFGRWEAAFALAAGLFLTFLLTSYLLIDIKRIKNIEILVETRTRELNEATLKAEAAANAKSEFMTNMSHEIRTPLNAISGLTELSLNTEGISETLEDYLKGIRNSSRVLLNIVDDILDFTKIESGRLTLSKNKFKLESLLKSISDTYAPKAAEKGLEFIISPASDLPAELYGDSGRLKQVLGNLVQNAIKFTETGEVLLRVGIKAKDDETDSLTLLFEVRDTGIGISRKRLINIFESFTQEDASFTRRFGGTGLGLSISRNLVQMMGGSIDAHSIQGQGSTFFFTLALKQERTVEDHDARKALLTGKRVLVVDENAAAAEAFSRLLNSFGLETEIADSGQEALACLARAQEENEFDIIFADWVMSKMSGLKLFQRIKSEKWISRQQKFALILPPGIDAQSIDVQNTQPDIVLNKPLFQRELGDLLAELFSIPSPTGTVKQKDKAESKEAIDLSPIKGARVLLVEDIELNQQVAKQILNQAGMQVVVANNGQECIDIMNKNEDTYIQAIFMDIQMPVLDGLEATKRLRSTKRFNKIPIIAMTAHALNGDREKGIEAGMDDYLTKPIDQLALKKSLLRWISPESVKSSPRTDEVTDEKETKSFDFSSLRGIDVKSGLDRLGGNQTLFRELLLKFGRKHALAGSEVRSLLERNERESAGRIIHTLKGISGNISAKELYQAAVNLEKEVKDHKSTDFKKLPVFEEALNNLVVSIGDFKSKTKPSADEPSQIGQPLDRAKAAPMLLELSYLLKTNDYKALKKLEEIKNATSSSVSPGIMSSLVEQINNFEFSAALTTLDAMAKNLDIEIEG